MNETDNVLSFYGRITKVMDKKEGTSRSGNHWESQEYLIEELKEQYPKKLMFEIFGEEKIKQMNIQTGEVLKVMLDVDCREYNGRYFNSIRAWKVERGGNPVQDAPKQEPVQVKVEEKKEPEKPKEQPRQQSSDPFGNSDYSDLPF